MSTVDYVIVLPQISEIDLEDLPKDLPVIAPAVGPAADETHGELATILALALTPVVVTAITTWLLRTHHREVVEYRVVIRRPDGSEKDVFLKISKSASKAPEAQVIHQIAEALGVSESVILSAQA